MSYIITLFCCIILIIAITLLIFPVKAKRALHFFFSQRWIGFVIVLRMLTGFVFIAASPATRLPGLMLFIGIGIIFIAMTTPLMSQAQLDRLEQWWLIQPVKKLRIWSTAAIILSLFLIWASLPTGYPPN